MEVYVLVIDYARDVLTILLAVVFLQINQKLPVAAFFQLSPSFL